MVRGSEDQDPDATGVVFNIQRFSLHDGTGIRTIVFLKGCPLRCLWCDNPESMKLTPELGFAEARCTKCGKCGPVCPESAISFDADGLPVIDRQRSTACGDCVAVCFPEALAIYGKSRSVAEVFEEVNRDAIFYEGSNGGVTVSGGEPLWQASFVKALFKMCREAGFSTAFESCGEVDPEALREVLKYTDLALFDLKHLDAEEHRRLTGKRNGRILQNAKIVADSGVPVQFRIPLVPGLTDTVDNIKAIAQFLRGLQGGDACIELMPYHALGSGKYTALDRKYPLADLKTSETEYIEATRKLFEESGVRCLVSK